MIHRYNTIFRNYNYSKNTYKIETREASLRMSVRKPAHVLHSSRLLVYKTTSIKIAGIHH